MELQPVENVFLCVVIDWNLFLCFYIYLCFLLEKRGWDRYRRFVFLFGWFSKHRVEIRRTFRLSFSFWFLFKQCWFSIFVEKRMHWQTVLFFMNLMFFTFGRKMGACTGTSTTVRCFCFWFPVLLDLLDLLSRILNSIVSRTVKKAMRAAGAKKPVFGICLVSWVQLNLNLPWSKVQSENKRYLAFLQKLSGFYPYAGRLNKWSTIVIRFASTTPSTFPQVM